MHNESSFSNKNPKISEGLQNFINDIVEEVVLKGASFEKSKKWLKKYSENEGLNFAELEKNIEDFFELYDDASKTRSTALMRLLKAQAELCFITVEVFEKVLNADKSSPQPKSLPGRPIIEWVDIPAGTFIMGSPTNEVERNSDETQHQVILSAFKISKYEVTFEQYDAFCDATGREKREDDEDWGRSQRPVINVNWDDATAFAEWMGCRLPTEAEWEYACRAGSTTPFNTGNNLTTSQANFDGNYPYKNYTKGQYREKTLPVGSFDSNAWGLYDMHGNVWEWCNDWYGSDYYNSSPPNNPSGPSTGQGRVARGGAFDDDAGSCRAARRNYPDSSYRDYFLGFRLASFI